MFFDIESKSKLYLCLDIKICLAIAGRRRWIWPRDQASVIEIYIIITEFTK